MGDQYIFVRVRKTKWVSCSRNHFGSCLFKCEWTDRFPVLIEQADVSASLTDKVDQKWFTVAFLRGPQDRDELLCLLVKAALCKLLIRIGKEEPDAAVRGQKDGQREEKQQKKVSIQSAAPSFRRIFFMCVSTMRVSSMEKIIAP